MEQAAGRRCLYVILNLFLHPFFLEYQINYYAQLDKLQSANYSGFSAKPEKPLNNLSKNCSRLSKPDFKIPPTWTAQKIHYKHLLIACYFTLLSKGKLTQKWKSFTQPHLTFKPIWLSSVEGDVCGMFVLLFSKWLWELHNVIKSAIKVQ